MANCLCRVRIHVPVDSNNNTLTPDHYPLEQCCGHYDLQICKTIDIGTSSNYESFMHPVISYGHFGKSEVAFFESGRGSTVYSGYRARLYHYNFSADEALVRRMLLALGDYLYGNSPNRDDNIHGKLVRYGVAKEPYAHYDKNSVNCFKAVAQWAYSLGQPRLQSIYNNAHNPSSGGHGASDYYAYKLAAQYAATYWQDMGVKQY